MVATAAAGSACGRLGFSAEVAPPADATPSVADAADAPLDQHAHASDGWTIAPLADLGAAFSYVQDDFLDGKTTPQHRDNAPLYVAALYPPFAGELAVIAGRSIIEIKPDGTMATHDYRPPVPESMGTDGGPDSPSRITVADLGDGQTVLWLTSSSLDDGDGLYRIDREWHLLPQTQQNPANSNNVFGLVFDATGSYDGQGVATLYDGSFHGGVTTIDVETVPTTAKSLPSLPAGTDDLAVLGNAMYFTVETIATAPDMTSRSRCRSTGSARDRATPRPRLSRRRRRISSSPRARPMPACSRSTTRASWSP